MRFFVKYIYWSRRIDLQRFQSDSGSLKVSIYASKKVSTENGDSGSHLRSDNDIHNLLNQIG